jgi:hypothetical protein
MPPWQRRQSRGFFTTTAQRIWVSPGFVSIQDGILASLKTVKEVSHTVSPGLAYLQASRRRNSPVYQISSRKHIRSLPLLNLITPQFTKSLLSPYIVSCICRSYHTVIISHHARPPRANHTCPNCTSIYLHHPVPPLLRLHAPTGKSQDDTSFSQYMSEANLMV